MSIHLVEVTEVHKGESSDFHQGYSSKQTRLRFHFIKYRSWIDTDKSPKILILFFFLDSQNYTFLEQEILQRLLAVQLLDYS